jgi:hypothetical protein
MANCGWFWRRSRTFASGDAERRTGKTTPVVSQRSLASRHEVRVGAGAAGVGGMTPRRGLIYSPQRETGGPLPTFKEANPEFQHLVRELSWLREHNKAFEEGDPQDELLLFSEASIVLVALERFLRIILGAKATEADTLPNLFEKATSRSNALITLPGDRATVIKQVKDVRNTLQHGNYEQAAREAGKPDATTYFGDGTFASEIEKLYGLLDYLVRQIDQDTGKRR